LIDFGAGRRCKDDIQMQILPVMDLLDGQVVRAVAGERWRYFPVRSSLTGTAEPVTVARALLDLAKLPALYIADLDAITRGGGERNFAVLLDICAEAGRSGVGELWLDAGLASWLGKLTETAKTFGVNVVTVVGAESLATTNSLQSLGYFPNATNWVLSLDYRAGKFLGPLGLDSLAEHWPRRVIVMELSVVGAGGGPALERLDALTATARSAGRSDIAFFAGGGVRDANDLRTLITHGAAGALVASALHDGELDAATINEFSSQ
jgi:phosphoribosylformimino-5-aminoimidazole carboxamide ribotide isomerase